MPIESICIGCGQTLSVADEHGGKQARCPACKTIYTVPHAAFQSPPGPTTADTTPGASPNPSLVQDSEPPRPTLHPLDAPTPGEADVAMAGDLPSRQSNVDLEKTSDYPAKTPSETNQPAAVEQTEAEPAGPTPTENDPFAETTMGTGSTANQADIFAATNELPEQFWMRTAEGNQYGPVDQANLNRWFTEGRVGGDYEIRRGENGPWLAASEFQPQTMQTGPVAYQQAAPQSYQQPANMYSAGGQAGPSPYAALPNAGGASSMYRYEKADVSGLVLSMGLLAWVLILACPVICWVPALVAWLVGRTAISDIRQGRSDPSNLSLVQVGYYLGIVNVVLSIVVIALLCLLAFLGILFD